MVSTLEVVVEWEVEDCWIGKEREVAILIDLAREIERDREAHGDIGREAGA